MATKQYLFSDRLIGISIQGTTVRIDLGVSAPAKGKDGKAENRVDPTHQLIMPLDAFLQAVAVQEKVVKELIAREKKRRENKPAAPASDKIA